MNLSALKYFNEVANTKSIRRAADRLHVSPSAVSRQLIQLERSLGARLIDRTNCGIELTPVGHLFEQFVQGMFGDLNRIVASIRDYEGLQAGVVKLGVMDGIASDFVPEMISEFNRQYPAITFNVISDSTDRMVEALIRNEADIAILYHSGSREGIEVIAERQAPVMCLLSRNHPFANRSSLCLADLCDTPIALPVGSFGLRQIFDRATAARKLTPREALTTNTLALTRSIALAGRALTIGPILSATRELDDGLLLAVPIDEAEFANVKSMICVHRERPLSFAAAEFLRKIKNDFARIDNSRCRSS